MVLISSGKYFIDRGRKVKIRTKNVVRGTVKEWDMKS